jgi:uncharacterized iron-regulated protein
MKKAVSIILASLSLVAANITAAAPATDAPPAPPWEATLARNAPLTGQIREPKSGTSLTPENLLDRLASADFVLLGERHDNPDHHRLQAWIVERLFDRGRRVAVAFEMIDGDQASRLARYFAASPRDAAGLGPALNWDRSGWPEWRHYQPIAAAAMTRGLPVIAANLPGGLARAIARDGIIALPLPFAMRLQLDGLANRAEAKPILSAHAADMQAAHCGQLPERRLIPFAQAQFARDANMARVMVDQWQTTERALSIVLIAGSGHVRTDRGVPWHLARMAPEARTIALGFVEADDNSEDRDLAALPYDVVWFTAQMERDDPCAGMETRR